MERACASVKNEGLQGRMGMGASPPFSHKSSAFATVSSMGIPSVLVPALRSALTSQGFPASTLREDGTLDPAGLLAGVYDTVEFRTALTPTVHINTMSVFGTGQPGQPPPPGIATWLKPTVVLTGAGQSTTIAPAGASAGGGWLPLGLVVAALVGVGVVIGRASV